MLPEIQKRFTRAILSSDAPVPAPRALLVFAHPDDETIALGARIDRFDDGLLVLITDGAPRNEDDRKQHGFSSLDDYRTERFRELNRTLDVAGAFLGRKCLGIPDQEASTHLVEITHLLAGIIKEFEPEVVFTHAYEGGHPDHDACAFAMHHAVSITPASAPLIIECALYHAGPNGIETNSFLPAPENHTVVTEMLTREEQLRKRAMFDCFATQLQTLRQFDMTVERFRVAPRYDFTRPPHLPPVLYDRFPWGMTSRRFCELAQEAEEQLGTTEVAA